MNAFNSCLALLDPDNPDVFAMRTAIIFVYLCVGVWTYLGWRTERYKGAAYGAFFGMLFALIFASLIRGVAFSFAMFFR